MVIRHIPLGILKDGTIYYGEITIYDRGNHKEFTASFDADDPMEINDEVLEKMAEEHYDWYSKEELEEIFGTTKKIDVVERLLEYKDELYDNSCFTDILSNDIDECEVVFLAGSGGQHDAFDEIETYLIPKKLVLELKFLWDNFHLKTIDEPTEQRILKLIAKLKKYKLVDVIIPYISKRFGKEYHT